MYIHEDLSLSLSRSQSDGCNNELTATLSRATKASDRRPNGSKMSVEASHTHARTHIVVLFSRPRSPIYSLAVAHTRARCACCCYCEVPSPKPIDTAQSNPKGYRRSKARKTRDGSTTQRICKGIYSARRSTAGSHCATEKPARRETPSALCLGIAASSGGSPLSDKPCLLAWWFARLALGSRA